MACCRLLSLLLFFSFLFFSCRSYTPNLTPSSLSPFLQILTKKKSICLTTTGLTQTLLSVLLFASLAIESILLNHCSSPPRRRSLPQLEISFNQTIRTHFSRQSSTLRFRLISTSNVTVCYTNLLFPVLSGSSQPRVRHSTMTDAFTLVWQGCPSLQQVIAFHYAALWTSPLFRRALQAPCAPKGPQNVK